MRNLISTIMLLMLTTLLVLSAAGCLPEEQEEEEFDRAALVAVDNYIEEMSGALGDSTLRADLQGWCRDYYEDDEPPFIYDEERREWLGEHKEELKDLREKHLTGPDFPDREDIIEWEVVIVRGEREWMLYGEEVIEALDSLEALYTEVITVIEMIIESERELNYQQSVRVLELLDDIDPTLEKAASVFDR